MDLFVIGDEVSGRCVSACFNAHAFAVGVIVDRRMDETDVAVLLGPFGLSIWWGDLYGPKAPRGATDVLPCGLPEEPLSC